MPGPQLKGLYSLEMQKLTTLRVPDSENFCIFVRAMIGPQSGDGEESFDLKVCSPKWLQNECEKSGYVFGRHHLILNTFDPSQIEAAVRKYIASVDGNTWDEVGAKLARIGHWEFEDYRE